MSNNLRPISIAELKGMSFFIPDYQRGYRWSIRQVKDLLEDINAFKKTEKIGMYCLQPLVVKSKDEQWEVIDGQQRLTTINILLSYLGKKNFYGVEYQTRIGSAGFLVAINPLKKEENVDYYHMVQALETITKWFEEHTAVDKSDFTAKLLNNVKFIWYESTEENPINVFTRLNIGKIALTNAELIKAMIMNRDNYPDSSEELVHIRQQKIALQWDEIENALENDEFWYFLNKAESSKSHTRIDFIFDLIISDKKLFEYSGKTEVDSEEKYRTFYFFYDYLDDCKDNYAAAVEEIWDKVLKIYYAFYEWYNDTELYHYIGFLIEEGVKLREILNKWINEYSERDQFIKGYIYPEIRSKIKSLPLDYVYDMKGKKDKTECKPILLLFNLVSIVNENHNFLENSKFKTEIHRRFPFHLYKREKWEVEHIDSATENQLDDNNARQDYLLTTLLALNDLPKKDAAEDSTSSLIVEITNYLDNKDKYEEKENEARFNELRSKIDDV